MKSSINPYTGKKNFTLDSDRHVRLLDTVESIEAILRAILPVIIYILFRFSLLFLFRLNKLIDQLTMASNEPTTMAAAAAAGAANGRGVAGRGAGRGGRGERRRWRQPKNGSPICFSK